jgi:hypothetical protein
VLPVFNQQSNGVADLFNKLKKALKCKTMRAPIKSGGKLLD